MPGKGSMIYLSSEESDDEVVLVIGGVNDVVANTTNIHVLVA